MTALPDPDYQAEFYTSVPAKRLVAWVVDSLLIVMLSAAAVVATAFVGLFVWPLLYLVVGFAYRVVTIANGSATWGMRFAGIELRDASGQRLDGAQALLHTAGYTLSLAIPVVTGPQLAWSAVSAAAISLILFAWHRPGLYMGR